MICSPSDNFISLLEPFLCYFGQLRSLGISGTPDSLSMASWAAAIRCQAQKTPGLSSFLPLDGGPGGPGPLGALGVSDEATTTLCVGVGSPPALF